MASVIKFFYTMITAVSVFFTSLFFPATLQPQYGAGELSWLEYPAEAVCSLEKLGLTPKSLTARADAKLPEYIQSRGYDDIKGVFISPYFTAEIGNDAIPVYSAMVFNRSKDTGDIHSFSEVYVDSSQPFSFNIRITGTGARLQNAIVLPFSAGVKALCKKGVVTASIDAPGIYTFLFNSAKQDYGYTLFVREKVDEEAEIRSYQELYGAENVIVIDSGVHRMDYYSLNDAENVVFYFRQGSYIAANHIFEIRSAQDEQIYIENDAKASNSIGLTRFPFINFYRCKNIKLVGHGAVDLTALDRRERRGVVFTDCENIEISGLKIFNSPEWSFISYCCRDLHIENSDIFGYRGNADGFAICNTVNADIQNCFARTADDEFEVKTLGGRQGSDNITFEKCIAWGGYARCFGICGEVNRPITDILFRDCAVIYRDGVWDNDRIGSLVVVAEETDGCISGVTFENIEIFRDEGRPILVKLYNEEKENFTMENIVFRNISYVSYLSAKIASNGKSGNKINVTLQNVSANGRKLSHSGGLRLKRDSDCEIIIKS